LTGSLEGVNPIPSRDVEINLVGNNRLSSSTRAAANDLEKLARKIDSLEKKLANIQGGKIKIDSNVDSGQAQNLGRRFGNAFSVAVGNAISDGSRAIGNGIKSALIKGGAPIQSAAAILGLRIAGFIGQAVTAGVGLFLGPALLAAPFIFLIKQQTKAAEEIKKSETRIAALKKRLEATKSKDVQERIRKEIAAERRILAEQEKKAAAWTKLKSRAQDFMEYISAPLKIPFLDTLDEIGAGLERLRKPMRAIVDSLGPALAPFTKGIMNGLIAFIKALEPALPGIVAGMGQWAKEMPKIGKALGDMFSKILANPDAVVTAITQTSAAIQGLVSFAGSVVTGLTNIGNAFHTLDLAAEALDKGNLAMLPDNTFGPFIGSLRDVSRALMEEKVVWLRALESMLTALNNTPLGNAWTKKLAASIRQARVDAEAELAIFNAKTAAMRAEAAAKPIRFRLRLEIADFTSKIKEVKAKLKDPTLTKTQRAKLELDLSRFRLQRSIAKGELVTLAKTKTKPKIQAAIDDLKAKVKTSKKSLKGVHDSKTRAKILADISQAEAMVRQLEALLRGIPDETVNINVVTRKSTITVGKKGTPGGNVPKYAAQSWGASLEGGGMYRTESPNVSVAAPQVSTRVYLDSREIGAVVRQTVIDENRKAAYRANVGRRN
jgi:hypothetical protein